MFCSVPIPRYLVIFLFIFCFVFGSVLALSSRGLSLFLFRSYSGLVPFLVVFRSYSSSISGSVLFYSGSVGFIFCVFGVPVLFIF